MSTIGARAYRPQWHFSPRKGWVNDPNGLVYARGKWHLFAQHNPHATVWGPMHWLHATSDDLLTWKEEGIAVFPDEILGQIFSGSAIVDEMNLSGLGENAPMALVYTHHGEWEQQSLAFSNDGLCFTPYAGNPVVPNHEQANFRDPKVFRDEARGRFVMVIAAGDHIEFHTSENLLRWEKRGEFGKRENKMQGIFECPDLFPLESPTGEAVWVLTASMALPIETGGAAMQYFIGTFDGETFAETHPAMRPRLLDSGFDNYAAVTFSGAKKPLLLGWASNWAYAAQLPTGEYCGQMTCARALRLVQTPEGLSIAQEPVVPARLTGANPGINAGANAATDLPSEVFMLDIQSNGPFSAKLHNENGEFFAFGLDPSGQFYADRTHATHARISERYEEGLFSVKKTNRLMNGSVQMRLYFDRCIAEIFSDGGAYAATALLLPEKPYTKLSLFGNASAVLRT